MSYILVCEGKPKVVEQVITYLGQLGAGMTKIETGSYTGTGTYGSGNPNELTFDFEPKFIFISISDGTGYYDSTRLFYVNGASYMTNNSNNYNNEYWYCHATLTGTKISWYSTKDSTRQCNFKGVTYRYIALA